MRSIEPRARQPMIWIGFLGGWTASGLAVATADLGGFGAFLVFLAGAALAAGAVYERRQRIAHRSDTEAMPSPWDGAAWEGWLMLAGRVIAVLVVVRILSEVPWSDEWTNIFWKVKR